MRVAAVGAYAHQGMPFAQVVAHLRPPRPRAGQRLHAARALDGVVAGAGLLNLGTFRYPQSGVSETKLTRTNTGNQDAEVDLAVAASDRHGAARQPGR